MNKIIFRKIRFERTFIKKWLHFSCKDLNRLTNFVKILTLKNDFFSLINNDPRRFTAGYLLAYEKQMIRKW